MAESRGIRRERSVLDTLRQDGWLAFRAPASLGVADVLALRAGDTPRLIEVKSDKDSPYDHFGPAKRKRLSEAARLAGAAAFLAWWPPRGALHWIPEAMWP